jgi:hypothetical protein
MPEFLPAPGTYSSVETVTLSAATPGATIYYTTDGSAPTTSSAQYSGAIPVSVSEVIQAIAVASGYTNSALATAGYIITLPPVPGPAIPASAIAANDLQALDTWILNHDAGTPGTAVGATSLASTPSLSGNARQFVSSYTNAGGEIYSVSYANDTTSSNFVYDGWVWIDSGSTIANLEMDSNQVTANGQTVTYAFQCDGYSHVWDYSGAGAHWVKSNQPCNLASWSTDTWHHVQISYSRDDLGNVTYNSVWLDGLGASGSSTIYLDNLTIYRW